MTSDTENAERTEQCGYPAANGPCQNPATEPDGSCWLDTHGDDPAETEADGRGAPEGNQHAVGNDGGAPAGNTRAAEHGLNMGVKRRLQWFKELGDPYISLFEDYYVEYHGKAENKSQAAALASAAVIRDRLEEHLLIDGVFYEDQIADPDELVEQGLSRDEAMERAFVDKPKTATIEAYTDACREIRLGLKYEGVSGNTSGGGSGGLPEGASALWED